ncbi:hypothetical protein MUK42_33394 [Musa troglodytarum]|uniref:Uncharacterized protein n=1 Tax=Musa troglodytarum TaxID=320322 RepID=A0A9E7FBB2_9LILI|nr:hypothetical protein MUK42_33394 [Musa troglodytarum]
MRTRGSWRRLEAHLRADLIGLLHGDLHSVSALAAMTAIHQHACVFTMADSKLAIQMELTIYIVLNCLSSDLAAVPDEISTDSHDLVESPSEFERAAEQEDEEKAEAVDGGSAAFGSAQGDQVEIWAVIRARKMERRMTDRDHSFPDSAGGADDHIGDSGAVDGRRTGTLRFAFSYLKSSLKQPRAISNA